MEDQNNSPVPNSPEGTTQDETEARYAQLALRMTVYPSDPRVSNPSLTLGKLPADLPFELPLPPQAQVIGSLIRSPQHIEITLDAALDPDAIVEFYTQHLSAAGWNKVESPTPGGGGFMGFFRPGSTAIFCRGSHGPALTVNSLTGDKGLSEVRLTYNADSRNSPCNISRQGMGRMQESLIPRLSPPKNTRQLQGGGGGGGSSTHWYTSAELETDLDLAGLVAHYTPQLEQASWQRQDSGQSGPVAWNNWQFRDQEGDPWHGTFFILQDNLQPSRYFLYIKIELDERQDGADGWSTSKTTLTL